MKNINPHKNSTDKGILSKRRRLIIIILDLISLPLIYWFVYATGGIKFVFSHTMYIPIVIAGITYGTGYGLSVGLIAGILLGPLMPIDVITGEKQLWYNWMYRVFIFMIIGGLSGYATNVLRKYNFRIRMLLSHNVDTNIPNKNSLSVLSTIEDKTPQTIITALINNHHNIIDILGSEVYTSVLKQIYHNVTSNINNLTAIVQADSNKFWIVFPHNTVDEDIRKITQILSEQMIVDDIPIYVDFALGLSIVSNARACSSFSTFSNADISARHAQINNLAHVVYEDSLSKKKSDFELLGAFREALENNQTFLTYQPKIDLKTMIPTGLEALIRWQHPNRGLIMPDNFIPLVEQTQLIHLLTDWVIKKAIEKNTILHERQLKMQISVNVSVKNLLDPEFINRVNKIIDEYKASPIDIEFEITESMLMSNPDEIKKILEKMKKRGHLISIDDFGTGYSSLAYLSQFPIDIVKIDRYFIQNLNHNESTRQIVESTIKLAHNLGFKVVAEGVENEEILNYLRQYGCDYGQGYYFAKPLRDQEIDDWYNKHKVMYKK